MGSSQPMTSPLPAASQGRFIGSSHLVAHRVGEAASHSIGCLLKSRCASRGKSQDFGEEPRLWWGKGLQISTKWRMLVYGNASFSLISDKKASFMEAETEREWTLWNALSIDLSCARRSSVEPLNSPLFACLWSKPKGGKVTSLRSREKRGSANHVW